MTRSGPLGSIAGFTYLAAIVFVTIMGIMLGAVGQSVSIYMKREKEKELIFRGLQYRDAIERWNKANRGPLRDLKDLEGTTLSSSINRSADRFIRKLYKDPITGGDWKTLPSPPDPIQGIYGVASPSDREPFKQSNFPQVLEAFDGKKKYSEWEFIYRRAPGSPPGAPPAPAAAGSGTGGTPAAGQPLSMPLSTPEGN